MWVQISMNTLTSPSTPVTRQEEDLSVEKLSIALTFDEKLSIAQTFDDVSLTSFKSGYSKSPNTASQFHMSLNQVNLDENTKKVDVARSNIWCKAQYIFFILLSIACAFTVMIIWYTVWLEDNKEPSQQMIVNNDTIAEDSTDCPFWEIAGDDVCDDEANIPECGYDFKDCCKMKSDRSLCEVCDCMVLPFEMKAYTDKICENAWFGTWNLGDGFCDLNYNKPEHYFDLGDCCLTTGDLCKIQFTNETDILYQFCPDNPCIMSNNFCITEELGDGKCQDHNNGPFCDYDMGDCCQPNRNIEDCCVCSCKSYVAGFSSGSYVL